MDHVEFLVLDQKLQYVFVLCILDRFDDVVGYPAENSDFVFRILKCVVVRRVTHYRIQVVGSI